MKDKTIKRDKYIIADDYFYCQNADCGKPTPLKEVKYKELGLGKLRIKLCQSCFEKEQSEN